MPKSFIKIFHFCLESPTGNFGDDLLFWSTKKTFEEKVFPDKIVTWVNFNHRLHTTLGVIDKCNECDVVLIGGGGLYLPMKDSYSGWQLNISQEHLEKIKTPIVVYSIGDNRFDTSVFYPKANKVFEMLLDKSIFFSMREEASAKIDPKIAYNPCPSMFFLKKATVLKKGFAINLAADRIEERSNIAYLAPALELFAKLYSNYKYVDHNWNALSNGVGICDEAKRTASNVSLIDTVWCSEDIKQAAQEYSFRCAVVMRGHAQMICLALGIPFYTIESHPKTTRFINDLNIPELRDIHNFFTESCLTNISVKLVQAKARLEKIYNTNNKKIRELL